MPVTQVTVAEMVQQEPTAPMTQYVDVRSESEFAAGHIPGAVNIPLDQIEARLPDLRPGSRVVLICKAGARARMAAGLLEPCGREVVVLEGGTDAWIKAGLALVVNAKTRWSLERQVRLATGLLTLAGATLALIVDIRWALFAGLIGLGLTSAGLTDFCPMGLLLAKMPWNRKTHCEIGRGDDMQYGCCK